MILEIRASNSAVISNCLPKISASFSKYKMIMRHGVRVFIILSTIFRFGLATTNSSNIIVFPLFTFDDPWMYFTSVSLGSPAQQLNMLIDTGSDLFWVNCPSNSSFQMRMNYYNLSESATGSAVSCVNGTLPCGFQINYYDGSAASGVFMRDALHYHASLMDSSTSSTNLEFGCSTFRNYQMNYHREIEGVLGLGSGKPSVVSQLSSQKVITKVFSHCLASRGNGFLIIGQVVDPDIVYTPVISKSKYKVSLESVAVRGQLIHIDPRLLNDTSIDSGSQLSLLAAEVFDTLVTAVAASLNLSSYSHQSQCYPVSTREMYPEVRLNFRGGASMNLRAVDYLIENIFDTHAGGWCINFRRVNGGTILGAPALRDKLVVYDLNQNQIGWIEHDCSKVPQTHHDPVGSQAGNLTWRMSTTIAALLAMYYMSWL